MRRVLSLAFILAVLAASCCREPAPEAKWSVSAAGAETPLLPQRACYQSLEVTLSGPSEGTQVQVSSDASWLRVTTDYLGADQVLPLALEANETHQRREAAILFTDAANPSRGASLKVVQLSSSDTDTNGEDAREVLYVGYGYDVYKALDSPMAVCTTAPILDYNRMYQAGGDGVYIVVQDCHLSRTETKYVATNDIHAYGENLTRQQTEDSEHSIEGCRENCVDAVSYTEPGFGTIEQQNFGHGTLEKAVAARVVDKGALLDLRRRNQTPYSEAFADKLRAIRTAKTADRRKKLVNETLQTFGTHVIIQVDLGGRIDYTFTMTKEGTFETIDDMNKQVDYTLGRLSDDELISNSNVSSSKSAKGAITVKGGSPATRAVLEADINGLSPNGQIPPGHITDWLASINYSDTPERDPNLDVIRFELLPVWDIVYADMRQDFLDATLEMVNSTASALPASFTGTDIYEISTSDKKLFDFSGAGDDGSLCRILYFDNEPVAEVCEEYVPKIRTDQRVTVIYPIYKQHIRLNQGIFIGDGVHQPAYVGFSDANSYVNPFDDLPPGTILQSVYYVNGNLLRQNPSNVKGLSGRNPVIRDDCFYYVYGHTQMTPIVKIGSQFWTRRDIAHNMGFTDKPNSKRTTLREHLVNGVLYTRFYHDVGYYQRMDNEWTWAYLPNTNFDGNPNMRWYLPSPTDIQNLHAYLGFNPKSLFKGQVGGFNANFNGYYGLHDILEDKTFPGGKNDVRYAGQINVIATRPVEELDAAIIAVLDKNYQITFINATGDFYDGFYPVRPVRGYMFEYPTIDIIDSNTY